MTNKEIIDGLVERAKELGWGIEEFNTDNYYAFYLFPPNSRRISVYTHKTYRQNGIHLEDIGLGMGVEKEFRQLTGHDYPSGGEQGGDRGCATVPLSIMKDMMWTAKVPNG